MLLAQESEGGNNQMIDKLPKLISTRFALTMSLILCLVLPPLFAHSQENSSDDQISLAEKHFREGVSLYKAGNYREALDEFNRVIALEPDNEDALSYRSKTDMQLIENEVEGSAVTEIEYEIFDPESLNTLDDPTLTAEEFKIRRVRENVSLGEQYLDHGMYKRAIEKFEQVLITAPDNKRATEGLHKAVMGFSREEIGGAHDNLEEQTQRIRQGIEELKLMPEGADVTGIKIFKLNSPTIEEKIIEEEELPTVSSRRARGNR